MSSTIIDSIRFSRNLSTLVRSIGAAQLPRLAELGCKAKEVRYRASGGANAEGRPNLFLDVTGTFELTCQRCLKPMEWTLSTQVELELVPSMAAIEGAVDDRDRVVASKAMDVDGMVEDEIILAVPMIPRHEVCEAAKAFVAMEKQSPFGVLSALRRGRRQT